MCAKPIAPENALDRLRAEGYEAEVRHGTLLVHQVPYVASDKTIKRGTLACPYGVDVAGNVSPPENHQVWWSGEFPCYADGSPLEAVRHSENDHELIPDQRVRYHFSNKSADGKPFADHHEKMINYIRHVSDQARVIDPHADARTGRVIEQTEDESVFRYADTASSRAEITGIARRLADRKIAIIGLGGTGSYILDLVAKTLVEEIHLYDGDVFEQHNAFRAPGAASIDDLHERLKKVEYFRRRYEPMRRGIVAHDYYITVDNIAELDDCSFVFVSVDNGNARKLICNYLKEKGVPYVDVGMGIELQSEPPVLAGTCRATLVTPQHNAHMDSRIPMMSDDQEALYGSNIQVADLNMQNACMAVTLWKQWKNFYCADFGPHHLDYTVNLQSLAWEECFRVKH